ncbi:hypothetical protein D9M68_785830 [compost metagenome]
MGELATNHFSSRAVSASSAERCRTISSSSLRCRSSSSSEVRRAVTSCRVSMAPITWPSASYRGAAVKNNHLPEAPKPGKKASTSTPPAIVAERFMATP